VTWDGAPCIDVLAETGIDLWFPDDIGAYTDPDAAHKVCRTCPLQIQCAAEGIAAEAPTGIWGGVKFQNGQPWRAIGRKR
jgi:hypothetical protein